MKKLLKECLYFLAFAALLVFAVSDSFAAQKCTVEVGEEPGVVHTYSASVTDYGNRWEGVYWVGKYLITVTSPVLALDGTNDNIMYANPQGRQFSMGINQYAGYYGARTYGLPQETVFFNCQ